MVHEKYDALLLNQKSWFGHWPQTGNASNPGCLKSLHASKTLCNKDLLIF